MSAIALGCSSATSSKSVDTVVVRGHSEDEPLQVRRGSCSDCTQLTGASFAGPSGLKVIGCILGPFHDKRISFSPKSRSAVIACSPHVSLSRFEWTIGFDCSVYLMLIT